MWLETQQLSIQQWFSVWHGWVLWLNSTKRLILSNGVPLWRRQGLLLWHIYNPEHTHRFTHRKAHTPTVHPFILSTVQRLWVHTDTDIHAHAHLCAHTASVYTRTHMLSCTLMKRKGTETTVHDKQLCNCSCRRLTSIGLCRGQLVYSLCGRRPGQQWSLLDWLWYRFINAMWFDVSLFRGGGVPTSCCERRNMFDM